MSNVPAEQTPPAPVPPTIGQATAVEQSRAVAEVQAAIVVAQQAPRNMDIAREQLRLSCRFPAMAEQAFYRFPRAGGAVTGPTVHLAREVARCFGNIDYGIAEMRRDDAAGESEMKAWAWDQQLNTRASNTFIVPHKRDKKGGPEKLVDLRDIYENNANMGARRLREAIFAVVPRWFTLEAEEMCRSTLAKGDGTPLPDRIAASVEAFAKLGINADRLEQKLGRDRDRWNEFDLAQLTVTYRSVQQSDVAINDEFPQARVSVEELGAGTKTADAEPATGPPMVFVGPCTPSAPCGQCDQCADLAEERS